MRAALHRFSEHRYSESLVCRSKLILFNFMDAFSVVVLLTTLRFTLSFPFVISYTCQFSFYYVSDFMSSFFHHIHFAVFSYNHARI